MKFMTRFLLMTRSLQGREDFSLGLEPVLVIPVELRRMRSAGMVMLNTDCEQKSRGGVRKSCAGNERGSEVWALRAEGLGCPQREQEGIEMVSVPP